MIKIEGKAYSLTDLLVSDQIEKIIVEKLQQDPAVHSYTSVDELLFEINFRKNIILSARLMNSSYARFADFHEAQCNPYFWILTPMGGFLQRPDVRSSDAIEDIFIHSYYYAFECATAIIIIYYSALLRTIGRERFNYFFPQLFLYSWYTDPKFDVLTEDVRTFIPGDVVYFNNPDVHPLNLQWRGENAVLLEDNTYFGHGVSIQTAQNIIAMLNQERIPGSITSAYLMNLATRPSFKSLFSLIQSKRTIIPKMKQFIPHNEMSISNKQYTHLLVQK